MSDTLRRCRPLLGTFVEVASDCEQAVDAAFEAAEAVHRLMSAHDPDSELSRINRMAHLGPVPVSSWTAAVIERAGYWARLSGGLFDIVRAGSSALRRGALPLHPNQPVPDPMADWTAVTIADGFVTLDRPACLDLGGIAKGFAVDRAVEAMIVAGATCGLVNAGGDLRGFGADPWPVTIVDPLTRQPLVMVDLEDSALATSAGLPMPDGRLDHRHVPGASPRWISVTVRADNACDADALTKILWSGDGAAQTLLDQAGAQAIAIGADRRVEPFDARQAVAA